MAGDNGVMRVRATKRLFYGQTTRRPGDTFDLESASDFAPNCMAWVNAMTPARTSTPQSVLDAESPVTARNRVRNRLMPVTGGEDDLVVHDWNPLED